MQDLKVPRVLASEVLLCREARRVTREASARVSALRSQNYEEYLRLATHAKDSRLRTLLEKTDAILSDLGHKVHVSHHLCPNVCGTRDMVCFCRLERDLALLTACPVFAAVEV